MRQPQLFRVFRSRGGWFLCFVFCLFLYASSGEAFSQEPGGFRGAPWWKAQYRFSSLVPFGEDGSWEIFRREGEDRSFGEALLDDVLYFFAHGRFSGVLLSAYGLENRDLMTKEASLLWGEGKPLPSAEDTVYRVWQGRESMVLFRYDTISQESRLWMVPFFPKDRKGKALAELQRDFSVLVAGDRPLLRSIPYLRGLHFSAPGEARSDLGAPSFP